MRALEFITESANRRWITRISDESGTNVQVATSYYNTPGARSIARAAKTGDATALRMMARAMSKFVSPDDILVPVPSRNGTATETRKLSDDIAAITGATVRDMVTGSERQSQYTAKQQGTPLTASQLGFRVDSSTVGRLVLVDNVIATGTTISAAARATGAKRAIAFAGDDTA